MRLRRGLCTLCQPSSRFLLAAGLATFRGVATSEPLSWASPLPPPADARWAVLGEALATTADHYDAGPDAMKEILTTRSQLETLVKSCGYDFGVYVFGGLVTMGFLEVNGDADFVCVADVEPTIEESGEIVSLLSREMRKIGLRAMAVPRARVPVVKVDRASYISSGLISEDKACSVNFQFTRSLLPDEQERFQMRLAHSFQAKSAEWGAIGGQVVTVTFPSTDVAVTAMSTLRKHGTVDIPLRVPVDTRSGPELYRHPFDLCLNSTGMRNTYLLREYILGADAPPFARHMLLLLKRWGRSTKTVSTMDGKLSAYAITVLLAHYLVKAGAMPPVDIRRITHEPHLLPKEPEYVPLPTAEQLGPDHLATLGYHFANFFHYFGEVFDMENEVVCTTTRSALTKDTLKWSDRHKSGGLDKPPFYHWAIKDPYGLENIGRNLDEIGANYVRNTLAMAHIAIKTELESTAFDAKYIAESLISKKFAPKPRMKGASPVVEDPGTSVDDDGSSQQLQHDRVKEESRRFQQQRQSDGKSNVRAARTMAKSVAGWIGSASKK